MTKQQVLEKARAIGRWKLGRTVRNENGCCPIEAAGTGEWGSVRESIELLGISERVAVAIMRAADGIPRTPTEHRLRKEMESWCS
jgi:hypothetical protein